MAETVLHVGGAAPYDVVVGHDLGRHLSEMLGADVARVAVISPAALEPHVDRLIAGLPGVEVVMLAVPDGEKAKSAAVAAACWEALGKAGFTRSDAVITVGGGATTDLGGFVAATWLRGVRVVHVPTTLLAMVDAAVGGKTGIDTGSGKNLVGSFHEPAGVICDLDFLATLPRAELIAGLGEVIKCGFIADPEILRLVEETDPVDLVFSSPVLRELIERAIRVKIDVVVDDLRETGGRDGHPGREALNYGHTMAHAIERTENYGVRHGEAVAIGCVFVAELARRTGHLDDATADRHREAFGRVGLPTGYAGADYETLREAMSIDKKTRGSQLRFVVLNEVGRPTVLAGPDEADLRSAYDAMRGAVS